ncbi:hypothetical protein [Hyphomicrobium sp. 2TAF46]|uniref:hypothetical protein n=1 Tax=Hyphomicrobium sp. 2TAF46 TaxID=3233019 RepID=UPI003F8F73EA
MPGFIAARQTQTVEYFILRDVTRHGRAIGVFSGTPISEAIVDAFGRRYIFSGIAPRTWSGKFNVECLGTGEFILPPGLVYRLVMKQKTPWWRSLVEQMMPKQAP